MNNNTMPIAYGNNGTAYTDPAAIRSLGPLPVMRNFSMIAPCGEWSKSFNPDTNGTPIYTPPTIRPRRRVMDLEKWGKRRIVKRLGLIQSAHDKQGQTFELQGFDQLPTTVPLVTEIPQIPKTDRDIWGNLLGKISDWGTTYLQTEKEKAEMKRLQAEAEALKAAKEIKTYAAGATGGMALPIVGGLILLGIFMLRK